ncbi:MAG: hypothetical protein ACRDOO_12660 [Actinomadura sp.]
MTSTCHIHADTDSVANAWRTKVESPLSVPVYDPPAENWSGASGSVANTRRTRLG